MKKIGLFIMTMACMLMVACGSDDSSSTTTVTKLPEVKKIVEPSILAYNNKKAYDAHIFNGEAFAGTLITQQLAITNKSDYETKKIEFIPTAYTLHDENMPVEHKEKLDKMIKLAKVTSYPKAPKGVTVKTNLNFFLGFLSNITNSDIEDDLIKSMLRKNYNLVDTVELSEVAVEDTQVYIDTFNRLKNIKTYSYDIKITYSNDEVQTISKTINFTSAHDILVSNTRYKNEGDGVNYTEVVKEAAYDRNFDGDKEAINWN